MTFNTAEIYGYIKSYLPKLALGLLILAVGWILCGVINGIISHAMKKAKVDATLRTFLKSFIGISLKILLIVTVVSTMGVEMSSFVAILAAAGFAVGLALQGSLSNFAGGVLILIFKPFRVGDAIDAQGHKGKVDEIRIFNTIIKTPDNKTIIIPNGILSNGSIINFSKEKERRVDFDFGIGYNDKAPKAIAIIKDLIKKDKRILKEPEPFVRITELGDSSVKITARVWAKSEDYWDINYDMIENVKNAFDKNRISIPYPQMDVHMKRI